MKFYNREKERNSYALLFCSTQIRTNVIYKPGGAIGIEKEKTKSI